MASASSPSDNDSLGMRQLDRDVLLDHRFELTKKLKVDRVLPHMGSIFDLSDCETIRHEKTSFEKAARLLDILPRRGPHAFRLFLLALEREHPQLCRLLVDACRKNIGDGGGDGQDESSDFDSSDRFLASIGLDDVRKHLTGISLTCLLTMNDSHLTHLGIENAQQRAILLRELQKRRQSKLYKTLHSLSIEINDEEEEEERENVVESPLKRSRAIRSPSPRLSRKSPSPNRYSPQLRDDYDQSYDEITKWLKEGIELLEVDLLDNAYSSFVRCYRYAKSLNPQACDLMASAVSHLGTYFCLKKDHEEAILQFKEALALYKSAYKTDEHVDVASTLLHLAELAVEMGDFDEAADWMEEHVSIIKSLSSDPKKIISALLSLRAIYQKKGLVADEIVLMNEVLDLQKRTDNPCSASIAKTLNELGALNVYKGDVVKAVECFQECFKVASDLDHVELKTAAWENLSAYVGDETGVKSSVATLPRLAPRRSLKFKTNPRVAATLPLKTRVSQGGMNGHKDRKLSPVPPQVPPRNWPPPLPPRNRMGTRSLRKPRTSTSTPLNVKTSVPGSDEFQDPRNPSYSLNLLLANKEISAMSIRKGQKLSHSFLSDRHHGYFMDPISGEQKEVLIKTLKDGGKMDESRRNMFFIEGRILVQLNHKNITTLFGISPATREPMIITQYFKNGSVMRFFAKECSSGRKFSLSQLLHMLMDICSAMIYLANKLCILRIVSSRVVYVTDDERCQITDFGFARKAVSVSCSTDAHLHAVPLQWTAPETFPPMLECTSQSDVWSFGIFMWEVMSLCQHPPYKGVKHEPPFIQQIHDGLRPEIFKPCRSELRKVMEECWNCRPQYRPSFETLELKLLDEMHNSNRSGYSIGPDVEFFASGHFIERI